MTDGDPETPRPGSRAKVVAAVLAAVVAFCCCGAGVGAFFVRRSVQETEPAQNAVVSFVRQVGAGDLDGAYGQLCAGTRRRLSRDEFAETVPARDRLVDVEVTGASVKGSPAGWTATVNADVYDRVGFRESYSFELVQEDGDWKVCGDPF